jgi:bacillithiol system protein YtxJ
MTNNGFIEIVDLKSLDRFLTETGSAPAVILKHSNLCGISEMAYEEMSRFDGRVGLVTVQRAREVSNELERRTGIEHESPQVLIFQNGKVSWSASHRRVTAAEVQRVVTELQQDSDR